MVDVQCEFEDLLYDIMMFCEDNECSAKQFEENSEAAVFQIVGIVNSIAAVGYQRGMMEEKGIENYKEEMKEYNFNMFQELGRDIGKLIRLTFGFNPKSRWTKENGY